MANRVLYSTIGIWLMVFGACAAAQETAPAREAAPSREAAPANGRQGELGPTEESTSEPLIGPVQQPPIIQATPFPTSPGDLQAAPDQSGNVLPGFGFPYGTGATLAGTTLTGTGITPFSQ